MKCPKCKSKKTVWVGTGITVLRDENQKPTARRYEDWFKCRRHECRTEFMEVVKVGSL